MSLRSTIFIPLTMLFLASCTIIDADRRSISDKVDLHKELAGNIERWNLAGSSSYTFTYQKMCYCGDVRPVVITVMNDVIESIRYADEGQEPVDSDNYRYYDTIPGIFARVGQMIETADEMTVRYNSKMGYPTKLSVDQAKNAVDDEFTITAADVEVMQ